MSDSLILSFAEVLALAGLADNAPGTHALDLLRLDLEDRTDVVRRAGLASLLARDLARADVDGLVLASGPRLVVAAISTLRRGFEVGVVDRDGGDGMVVLDADGTRIVVSPRAYGCYAVASLDAHADLSGQLTQIVENILVSETEAVAAVVVADPEPSPERSTVVGVEQGRWYVASTGPDGARTVGSRDEVLAALTQGVQAMTAL